jgi:hypothetical protein
MSKPQLITFVYNPDDWEYISNWILRHHPDQRSQLFIAAAMGWNLAIYLSNKDSK